MYSDLICYRALFHILCPLHISFYHFAGLYSVKSHFSIFEYDNSGFCCLRARARFVIGSWLIRTRIKIQCNAMHGKTKIWFIFQHRQSKIISSKSQNSRLVNSGRMLLAAGIDSAQKANPVSTRSHRVQKCEILRLQRSGRRFSEKYLCLEDPGGISGPIAHSD